MKLALTLTFLLFATSCFGFNFLQFMSGEWDIEHVKSLVSSHHDMALQDVTHQSLKLVEDHVEGHFFNANGDKFVIKISPNEECAQPDCECGKFFIAQGSSSEFDENIQFLDFVELFSFKFHNYSNGFLISQGKYGKTGTYQFVIPNAKASIYSLTVIENDEEGKPQEIQTMLASKFVDKPPKTFFQQYGMMIMMLAFFIFRTVMGKFVKQPAQAQPDAADVSAVKEMASKDATKPHPRVEEITEEKKDK